MFRPYMPQENQTILILTRKQVRGGVGVEVVMREIRSRGSPLEADGHVMYSYTHKKV